MIAFENNEVFCSIGNLFSKLSQNPIHKTHQSTSRQQKHAQDAQETRHVALGWCNLDYVETYAQQIKCTI